MRLRLAVAALLSTAVSIRADVRGSAVTPEGQPVAGARVELFAATPPDHAVRQLLAGKEDPPVATAVTDAKGNFRLAVEKPGNFMLYLSADGHAPAGLETTGAEDLGGLLLRPAALKSGRVTAGGKPVANATLLFARMGRYRTKTADDGSFSVPDPAVWLSGVTVYHPEYALHVPEPAGFGTPPVPLDFRLDGGVTLRGRILAPDGKTGAKAQLFVDHMPAGESADDGTFTIARVPATWRQLTATAVDLAARAGRSAPLTLRLSKALTFRGSVVDPKSRLPLPRALVSLEMSDRRSRTHTALTDAKGDFAIPSLLPGTYRITAGRAGYAWTSVEQSITAATPPRTLYLQQAGRISGTIVDGARRAVGGVQVRTAPRARDFYSGGDTSPLVSAADGRYMTRISWWFGDTGELDVIASRSGFATTKDGPHAVAPGEEKRVDLVLDRGVAVTGTVTDAAGTTLRGVSVGAMEILNRRISTQFRGDWSQFPATDAEGKFTLRLRPGNYDLYFHHTGFAPKKVADVKAADASEPVEVKLEPAAAISGRVVAASGEPMPGFRIYVPVDGPPVTAVTDTNGAFVLNDLPPQQVVLDVSSENGTIRTTQQVKAPAENVVIELMPTVRVSGRVQAKGGGAVTDFSVEIVPPRQGDSWWSGMSSVEPVHDADGRFVLPEVPVTPSDLQVRAPGYTPARVPLRLEKGQAIEDLEVTLDRAGTVRGRVTNESGAPVERVHVATQGSDSARGWSTEGVATDANGEYALESVPLGETMIVFMKSGFQQAKKPVKVDGSDKRLDVQLSAGRSLGGRVVTEEGAAVAEAEVTARTGAADGSSSRAVTDASGRFRLEGLGSGIYSLHASRRGYLDAELTNVNIATASEVTLTLTAGATLTGRVSGIDPSRFAQVIVSAAGSGKYAQAPLQANGTYRMEGAPTGKIGVRAVARGAGSLSSDFLEIETQNGGTYTADLEFREHNTVRGRVTRRGVPLRSGMISFSPKTGRRSGGASGTIDTEGRYEVAGVRSGEHEVVIADIANRSGRYLTTRSVTHSETFDIDINPAILTGLIVNDATGEPLADVAILLELPESESSWLQPQGRSGSDGRVLIENIPPGTYSLLVMKEGFASHVGTQTLVDGATANLNVRLTPAAGLSLRIIDGRNGQPVRGWVGARDARGVVVSTGYRSPRADGTIALPLAPGSYRLNIMADGLSMTCVSVTSPGEQTITLHPGGTLDIATPGGVMRGRILAGDGSEYHVSPSASSATFRIMDGTIITDMAPGAYTLQVLDDAGRPGKGYSFEIRQGETTRLRL